VGIAAYPLREIGVGAILLHAPVRVDDLGWPVGVYDHHAVVIQQSPPLAGLECVEKPNTHARFRLLP